MSKGRSGRGYTLPDAPLPTVSRFRFWTL